MNDYTLELTIDRSNKLTKVQFFNDQKDPYQVQNLDTEKNKRAYLRMLKELAKLLKNAEDRWYDEKILGNIIPYE